MDFHKRKRSRERVTVNKKKQKKQRNKMSSPISSPMHGPAGLLASSPFNNINTISTTPMSPTTLTDGSGRSSWRPLDRVKMSSSSSSYFDGSMYGSDTVTASPSKSPSKLSLLHTSETSWNRRYQRLQSFYNKYGHSGVPVSWALDPALGDWACRQRQYYREIRSGYRIATKLDESRWKQLQELQFPLDYETFHWTKRYNELQEALGGERFDDYVAAVEEEDGANTNVNDEEQHQRTEQKTYEETSQKGEILFDNTTDGEQLPEQSVAVETPVGVGTISTSREHPFPDGDKGTRALTTIDTSLNSHTIEKLNPILHQWVQNEQDKSMKLWWSTDDGSGPNHRDGSRISKLERLGVPIPGNKN